jgi:UPF0755 protein
VTRVSLSDIVPGGGGPEQPSRRGAARAKERRRKRRRRRSLLVLLIALLVLGGAGYGAYLAIAPIVRQAMEPNDFAGPGTTPVTAQVAEGATGSTIARELAKLGVVKTAGAFVDAAKKNPDSASIQPGTYRLKARMSAAQALTALLDPVNRIERKVTIAEGKRLPEILAALAKGLNLPPADLQAAATALAAHGLPGVAHGNLEGYLFPSTYTFQPDATAADVLKTMVDQTMAELTKAGVPRAAWQTVLTKASLAQAESGSVKYMPQIARVLENRLAIGKPLQLDTTIHYATGRFTLTTTLADLRVNSPYNTYLHAGLPPGPICSPGAAAIGAVTHPAAGPWLYFTTTDPSTGLTKFATTLAQKAAMDAEFRAWQKAHPGK